MVVTRSTHVALYLVLLKPNSPLYLIHRVSPDSLAWDIPIFQRDAALNLNDNVTSILQDVLRLPPCSIATSLKCLHRFSFNYESPSHIVGQGYVEAVYVGITDQDQVRSSISSHYPEHIWATAIDCVAKLRQHMFVEGILMADQHIRQSGNF